MTMNNQDEPANPVIDASISTHEDLIHYGLTKFEHVGLELFKGLLSGQALNKIEFGVSHPETNRNVAKGAFALADAFFSELEARDSAYEAVETVSETIDAIINDTRDAAYLKAALKNIGMII